MVACMAMVYEWRAAAIGLACRLLVHNEAESQELFMMSFKYRSKAGRLDLRRRDSDSTRGPDSSQFAITDADDASRAWSASSQELRQGVQVSEQPMDTLPGELLDEFFKR